MRLSALTATRPTEGGADRLARAVSIVCCPPLLALSLVLLVGQHSAEPATLRALLVLLVATAILPALFVYGAYRRGRAQSLDLSHRPRNTRVVPAPGTIAAARQLGAERTDRRLLVFSDADVTFAADYFARLVVPGPWYALCGAKLSRGDFQRYSRLVCAAQQATFRLTGVATASGSNMAITRAAFSHLGGFRPELPCNEDTELFLRAQRLGLRVRFDPKLIVWAHDHRRLRRGLLVKSLHSLSRNLILYATCRQRRLPGLLEHDWAYRRRPNPRKEQH